MPGVDESIGKTTAGKETNPGVVITGSTRGLGFALAKEFLERSRRPISQVNESTPGGFSLLSQIPPLDDLGDVRRSESSDGPGEPILGMGLAPMAVLPERQRAGIGSQLVREGLKRLRAASTPFVIVLGHPEYYPRFGFQPASRYGIQCQWEGVPDQAFMILIFHKPALRGVSGVARYRDEFDEAV